MVTERGGDGVVRTSHFYGNHKAQLLYAGSAHFTED